MAHFWHFLVSPSWVKLLYMPQFVFIVRNPFSWTLPWERGQKEHPTNIWFPLGVFGNGQTKAHPASSFGGGRDWHMISRLAEPRPAACYVTQWPNYSTPQLGARPLLKDLPHPAAGSRLQLVQNWPVEFLVNSPWLLGGARNPPQLLQWGREAPDVFFSKTPKSAKDAIFFLAVFFFRSRFNTETYWKPRFEIGANHRRIFSPFGWTPELCS